MLWLIALLSVGLVIGLPLLAYAVFVEPYQLRLRRETLETDDLPPGLDGLTILHLSDLHLRRGNQRRAEMVQQVADVEADVVAITGDFIETDEDIDYCVQALAGLRARYGVFAVLGNHDHLGDRTPLDSLLKIRQKRNDVRRLVAGLEAAGIRVLSNESQVVRVDGQELWVVGVDDPHRRLHDLRRALQGVPEDAYRLLLAHSPEVVDQLRYHRVNLVLSGHTHGGQVVFPLVGALVTRTRYPVRPASGWRSLEGIPMHVSRGVGASLTLRFNCPPEANLIQMKARPRLPVDRAAVSQASEQHQEQH